MAVRPAYSVMAERAVPEAVRAAMSEAAEAVAVPAAWCWDPADPAVPEAVRAVRQMAKAGSAAAVVGAVRPDCWAMVVPAVPAVARAAMSEAAGAMGEQAAWCSAPAAPAAPGVGPPTATRATPPVMLAGTAVMVAGPGCWVTAVRVVPAEVPAVTEEVAAARGAPPACSPVTAVPAATAEVPAVTEEVAAARGAPPACSPVTAVPAATAATRAPTPSATVVPVEPGGSSADPAATGYPVMPDPSHLLPALPPAPVLLPLPLPAPVLPDIQRTSGRRSAHRREGPADRRYVTARTAPAPSSVPACTTRPRSPRPIGGSRLREATERYPAPRRQRGWHTAGRVRLPPPLPCWPRPTFPAGCARGSSRCAAPPKAGRRSADWSGRVR